MKKNLLALALLLLISSVYAGQFATNFGEVRYIRSYGDTNAEMWSYIQIEGVGTREGCAHHNFGVGDMTYFAIKKDESHLLSIVLTASMLGKKIKVTSNDTPALMANGEVCRLIYLDIKP